MIFSAVHYQVSLEGYQTICPFHLQRVNKLYRKFKPVRIKQQKEHLLIQNPETTQNLNIYLPNYQTETNIFLAEKHEKKIMACSCLNFSPQKICQNSKKCWLLWGIAWWKWLWGFLVNFCCYEYGANPSEAVQKRRLAKRHCWSYANSLNS